MPTQTQRKPVEVVAHEDAQNYRLMLRLIAHRAEWKVTQPGTLVDVYSRGEDKITVAFSKAHLPSKMDAVVGEKHYSFVGPGKLQQVQELLTGVADPERKIAIDKQFKANEATLRSGKGLMAIKIVAIKAPVEAKPKPGPAKGRKAPAKPKAEVTGPTNEERQAAKDAEHVAEM